MSRRLAEGDRSNKGAEFEKLIAHELPYLKGLSDVKEAWRMVDVPQEHKRRFWRGDAPNGIDVLALKQCGNYIAIQCKCFNKSTKVTSKHVDDLAVAVMGHDAIDQMFVITTVDVAEPTRNHLKGVVFKNTLVDWADRVVGRKERPVAHSLDTLQQAAFNDCIKHFVKKKKSRGKLIMACGTGKTLVAQRVAEHPDITPDHGLVVYATPSILLTGQSQVGWLENRLKRPIASFVVCSDTKAGVQYGEKYRAELSYDLVGVVTTTPERIAHEVERLRKSLPENGIVVIFTTYQSMDKVVEAQRKYGLSTVDFAIADEAHWTAGKWSGKDGKEKMSRYLMFHNQLDADRRMYQTATPRIYSERSKDRFAKSTLDIIKNHKSQELVDMRSTPVFGEEIHSLSFRQALADQEEGEERLCDYRVVIAIDTSREVPSFALKETYTDEEKKEFLNTRTSARLTAVMESMVNLDGGKTNGMGDSSAGRDRGLRSCIAFSNRVWRAKAFADEVNNEEVQRRAFNGEPINLSAGHLDGESPASERKEELGRLAEANDAKNNKRHITFNVRVLSEGVDVPALDSVAFIDERDSEIDIVQAVGRVMRRPPGSNKTIGYVIVPVGMGKWVDCEKCMASSPAAEQWKILGQVLRGLRSHDPEIKTNYHDRIIVSPPPPHDPELRKQQQESERTKFAQDFAEHLMAGEFEGVSSHIMPYSGVLRESQEERKSVMQYMVGSATKHLLDEGLGSQLLECTGTEADAGDVNVAADDTVESNDKSSDAGNNHAFRACQAAALHLTLCMLTHQRLFDTRANQPPIAKLKSPRDCSVGSEIGDNLLDQWGRVLKHDFKPIFGPGVAVLQALRNPSESRFPKGAVVALEQIAESAAVNASKYVEIGADEAGEIFQAAMDKSAQKKASAWYTVPVAGVLLAEMTCDAYAPKTDSIWRDPEYWRKHAILDPACGSGTLLIAMMSAIVRRAQALGADEGEIVDLRRALIEDSLTGLDINKWAVQLAATQMAISVGSAPLSRMGLYEMPKKDEMGRARLGSLELLLFNNDGTPRSLSDTEVKSKGMDLADVKAVTDSHEGLLDRMKRVDICIANPPFGTFEQQQKDMSQSSKDGLKNRKDFIHGFFQFGAGKNPLEGASNSLSPWFTLLMTSIECSVMGKIAPQIALVSPGPDERNYIRDHYDMVDCVTSHESVAKPSWSSESKITESMLVFKRKQEHSPDVRFTSVSARPVLEDATNWSDWQKSTFITSQNSGWWHSSFCNEGMHAAAEELVSAFFNDGCWITVGEMVKKNVLYLHKTEYYSTHVVDGTKGQAPILRGIGEKNHRKLALTANAVIGGLPPHELESAEGKMSTLLHASAFDPRSSRLHAAHIGQSCLGDRWVTMSGVSQRESKGLSVFLNSTIHRINLLMSFSKKLQYPLYNPKAIKSTFIPNIWNDPDMLDPLLGAYNKTSDMEVTQFRDGYTEIRQIWDKAVAAAIKIGGGHTTFDQIKSWAEIFTEEPLMKAPGKGRRSNNADQQTD